MKTEHFKILEGFRHEILNFKISLLDELINHYETAFLPEFHEYRGYSQYDKAESLRKEKESLISESRQNTSLELLYKYHGIDRTTILNALRLEATKHREFADQWKENPLIKYRWLRKAVKTCKVLIEVEPQLNIYSWHWLTSRNVIKLN